MSTGSPHSQYLNFANNSLCRKILNYAILFLMYISELIIDFLEHLEVERGRSQKTAENYHLYLQRLVEFAGDVEVDKINSEMVRKWRLWLNRYKNDNDDEIATITQSYHLIALRSFLTYCAKRNLETLGPEMVELPKINRKQVTFLHKEEIERLVDVISTNNEIGLRDKAIIELLLSSGLRVSELASLNRDHVNTKRREFMVRGKGQKDRPVFISEHAAENVANYLAMRADSLPPLFISYSGKTGSPDNSGDYKRDRKSVV